MKQIFKLLSTLLMCYLVFSLTACGSSSGTSSNSETNESEASEEQNEEIKVLTDEELEDIAVNEVFTKLDNSKYDFQNLKYWRYKVTSIERNVMNSNYSTKHKFHYVYGKVLSYNQYDEYTGGTYYFEVVIWPEGQEVCDPGSIRSISMEDEKGHVVDLH